jgi:hypothetical protein
VFFFFFFVSPPLTPRASFLSGGASTVHAHTATHTHARRPSPPHMSFPSTSSPPASPLAPPADKADAWVPYVQRIQARQGERESERERVCVLEKGLGTTSRASRRGREKHAWQLGDDANPRPSSPPPSSPPFRSQTGRPGARPRRSCPRPLRPRPGPPRAAQDATGGVRARGAGGGRGGGPGRGQKGLIGRWGGGAAVVSSLYNVFFFFPTPFVN